MMSVRSVGPFVDKPDADPGHRLQNRDTGIHQSQSGAADRRHGAAAVGFKDVRDQADGIGELFGRWNDGRYGTFRQTSVTNFAATGASDWFAFAD
jgi:hypothetical protein